MKALYKTRIAALALPMIIWLGGAPASAGTGLVFVSNERSSQLTVLDQSDTVIKQIKTCANQHFCWLELTEGSTVQRPERKKAQQSRSFFSFFRFVLDVSSGRGLTQLFPPVIFIYCPP